MTKLYYENIDFADCIEALPFILVFAFCLVAIMGLFKIRSLSNVLLVFGIFIFYHLLLVLDLKLNFIPYLPDSKYYVDLFLKDEKVGGSSLIGFYYLSKLLGVLFLKNIVVYISFQILLFITGVLTILKSWELLYSSSVHYRHVFLGLSLFSPAGILFTLVPLRESIGILAFALSLFGLLKIIKYFQVVNKTFVLGSFLVFFTRVQVLVYFVFSLIGLKWIFEKSIFKKGLVLILGVLMLLGFVQLTHHNLSIKSLSIARNYRVNTYSNTYGNVSWDNPANLLIDAPLLVGQFVLSPLPILHKQNPLDTALMLIDVLFVIFALSWILGNLNSSLRQFKLWLILIGIYMFLFGIYEFHIGGAVRHRIPMVLMMCAISAHFIKIALDKLSPKTLNS